MLKTFSYFLLLVAFFIPICSHSDNPDAYQKLASAKKTERLEALQDIEHSTDQTLQQKLIEIALFDPIPEIRMEAENTLSTIQPMNTNDLKLRAQLTSIFPREQITALKSIKNVENIHPVIQYLLLKEFIFRSLNFNRDLNFRTASAHSGIKRELNLDMQRELIRIIASYPYFQYKLLLAITSDKISETVHFSIKDILKRVFESLDQKAKKKLIDIATSNTTPKIARNAATDIVIEGFKFLDLELQRYLFEKATSDTVPEITQKASKNILVKGFKFLKPEMQQELIDRATSSESFSLAQNTAQHILIRGSKWTGVFVDLERQQDLLNKATSDITLQSENTFQIEQKNPAKDILIQRFDLLAENTLKELVHRATSDMIPDTEQRLARGILWEAEFRHPSLIIEKELLQKIIDDTSSKRERNAAKNILLRRIHSNSIVNLDEVVQKELAYIATSSLFSRTARNTALDIFIQIDYISPSARSFKLKCQIAFRKLVRL